MTDYAEEQAMEVEALESIYMETFQRLESSTYPTLQYQVDLVPHQDGDDTPNFVSACLKFTLPETYPDVAPEFEFSKVKGLSEKQVAEMQDMLQEQVEENLGMAMAFTLCEAVKEYLLENNQEGNDGSEYQEMVRRAQLQQRNEEREAAINEALEEEEDESSGTKKVEGTPVTVESFMAWKTAFSLENLSIHGKFTAVTVADKPTGKKLWQQGLAKTKGANSEDEEDESEDDENENDDDDEIDENDL